MIKFLLTGVFLMGTLGIFALDNFEEYADDNALQNVFTAFDTTNNPFPSSMKLMTEPDQGKFVRFSSSTQPYAVIVRKIPLSQTSEETALHVKMRGSFGTDRPLTGSIGVRPSLTAPDAANIRVNWEGEWQDIVLECPAMKDWKEAYIIFAWNIDNIEGKEIILDMDDIQLEPTLSLAKLAELKKQTVFGNPNTAIPAFLPIKNIPEAHWSIDTYGGRQALILQSAGDTMESAIACTFTNPVPGRACAVTIEAADPGTQITNGMLEFAIRATVDGPDLAVRKIPVLQRTFEPFTVYVPELKDLPEFTVVLRAGRRDLEEQEYGKFLYDFYGAPCLSETTGTPLKAAIATIKVQTKDDAVSVIPKPRSVTVGDRVYTLSKRSAILANSDGAKRQGQMLRDLLTPATGYTLPVVEGSRAAEFRRSISLLLEEDAENIPPEGYELVVVPDGVTITASTESGLFYGIQTLRQLLPAEIESPESVAIDWTIPEVKIIDAPQYGWRGMHLDTARHFMPKSFLYKFIDMLALNKMNRFHWHYNDGTGWRIELEEFPKLTAISAWWGEEEGGYYTEEDVKEIIEYARQRFITIMPEVEMPAHANAALFAYPEYSCQKHTKLEGQVDYPSYYLRPWGFTYCPSQEKTYEGIEKLIAANARLFPDSEFIHIGGDELPPGLWESCESCKAFMAEKGFKSEAELQNYFTQRIEAIGKKYGKRLMGWEQILNNDLSSDTAIIAYLSPQAAIRAAENGNDVVSNNAGTNYLDYYQGDPKEEPIAISSGISTLKTSYNFNPVDGVPEALQHHILGGQSALWTEYIPNERQAGYQLYPRGVAIAEKLWSNPEQCDFSDFEQRLNHYYLRMILKHVHFKDYR